MLRGYWRAIIALGLVATLALGLGGWLVLTASESQALIEQEAAQKAAAYANHARVHVERYCVRLSPAEKHDCIHQAAQAARQGTHDERDLEAQLVTSVWTRYMGLAAIGGTAFGIIGVLLILATFRENKRSADAAHDANRPWVEINATGLTLHAGHGGANIDFMYSMHNHGNSPATGIVVVAALEPIPRSGFRPEDPILPAVRKLINQVDERSHRMGSAIFPGNNEIGSDLVAEAGPEKIAAVSEGGTRQLRYVFAVGASYLFGNRICHTVKCYDLFVREDVTYNVPGHSHTIKLRSADITDTYEGFAT